MAREGKSLVPVGTSGDWRADWNAEIAWLNERHDEMMELDEDDVVGTILAWPVADGRAYYMVTKDSPLTINHIEIGDGWQVDQIMIRGLRKQDVIRLRDQKKRMLTTFGRSQPCLSAL